MAKQPKIKMDKDLKKQGTNKEFIDSKWGPGKSGNPKGRPKGTKSIPDTLRRFGELPCPADILKDRQKQFPGIKTLTVHEAELLGVHIKALEGESWAVQFIAERTEGKVVQPQEITLPSVYDLTKLSTAELLTFKTLQGKIEIKETANA